MLTLLLLSLGVLAQSTTLSVTEAGRRPAYFHVHWDQLTQVDETHEFGPYRYRVEVVSDAVQEQPGTTQFSFRITDVTGEEGHPICVFKVLSRDHEPYAMKVEGKRHTCIAERESLSE